MRIKWLTYLILMALVLSGGGIASADLDRSDNNNDEAHAQPIGLQEIVDGVVNPEDPFDFYTFDVAEGQILTGSITLDGMRQGTTLRLEGAVSGRLYYGATVDDPYDIEILINADTLAPDTYYIRVYHYQVYADDHEYILILDLAQTQCFPDGNEEPENAVDIGFNTTTTDWVCPDDRIDIYRFSVDSNLEGAGSVSADPHGEELRIFLYDSDWNELDVEDDPDPDSGEIEIEFGDDDRLEDGEYYIGVFLPFTSSAEVEYDLELKYATISIGPGTLMVEEIPGKDDFRIIKPGVAMEEIKVKPDKATTALPFAAKLLDMDTSRSPWPNTRGDYNNNGRSIFKGPTHWLPFHKHIPTPALRYDNYRGLIAGVDNLIYYMSRPANILYCFYVYEDAPVWSVQTGSNRPACLDYSGNIYYIHESSNLFYKCTGNDNTQIWTKTLSQSGSRAVELVGGRVYVSTVNSTGPSTYVYSYTLDGAYVWDTGALDGRITGVAEDVGRGFVYVQTSQCLYQYNWDGTLNWFSRFPVMDEPSNTPGPFPPMVASNGDVWAFYQRTLDALAYSEDKELLSMKAFTNDTRPISVCLGEDDRLYFTDGDKVYCYEDWDELVWEWDPIVDYPNSTIGLRNIAMDGEGHLYVWFARAYQPPATWYPNLGEYVYPPKEFSYRWKMLNIEDGTKTTVGAEMDLYNYSAAPYGTDPIGTYGGMAIGEDDALIILHVAGECYIFMDGT